MELTNICDFDCIFCPKSEMRRPYGYMDTALAKHVLTEIGSNGICKKVTFHVMGEPTFHRDFFEILDHSQNEGLNIGLTTNGSRLGGDIGRRLLNYNLFQLDISLQTPDERSFILRNAGSKTFEAYISGILDFFSSYYANKRETIFKFRFLNTRFRKKGMEKKIGRITVMSSAEELRNTFRRWANLIYDIVGFEQDKRDIAMERIESLVPYKWNVVEVCPNVYFETYVLDDWGHAFDNENIRGAWAGYCFGMRDHFSILYNGDVTLCCIDFDGNTKIGNLNKISLKEALSSDELGRIIDGFKRFRLVHPYCKRCLGSRTFYSWLFKPVASVIGLKVLKPFFYRHTRLFT